MDASFPVSRSSRLFGALHAVHPAAAALVSAAMALVLVLTAAAQEILPPMVLQMTSPAGADHRMLTGTASVPRASPWMLERGLSLAAWAPVLSGREAGGGAWRTLSLDLQPFPLLPPAPSPVAGAGPRPHYHAVQARLTKRADGGTVAVWRMGGDWGNTAAVWKTAVFPASELPLSHPADPVRQAWGIGTISGPLTDPWPIFLSFFTTTEQENTALPAASTLTGNDAAVRAFLVARQTEIREQIWPLESTAPWAPPAPPTPQQRSFFRVKAWRGGDSDNDGLPDGVENQFGAGGQLILSEACFLRAVPSGDLLTGGESADFIKVLNPCSTAISASGYWVSDKPSPSETGHRFALPSVTLQPGAALTIYCNGESRARLDRAEAARLARIAAGGPPEAADPLLAVTAPFDLTDTGEKVYLLRGASHTEVHRLSPPSGAFPVHGLANVSFGIYGTGSGATAATATGFFETASDPGIASGLNPGFAFPGGAVAEPVIMNADTGLPLAGRVFRSGTIRVRLDAPETGAGVIYTLNSAEPTGDSAFFDPASPLEITGTTILRARAVKSGKISSGIVTRTFWHTPTVVMSALPDGSGRPLCDGAIVAKYTDSAPDRGGDPAASPVIPGLPAAGGILAQLEARPIISLSWGRGALMTADGWTGSMEYLDPANPAAWSQQNVVIKGQGNHPGLESYNPGDGFPLLSKASFHLQFKKTVNLQGTGRWQGPVVGSGTSTTSAVFPGSPVTSFSRLILRDPHSDGWANPTTGGTRSGAHFCHDVYLKETQRALGAITGRTRWVHVLINGVYWGMYVLGEFNNADMISDYLKKQFPSQEAALGPEGILVWNNSQADQVDPDAFAAWNELNEIARQAGKFPSDSTAWNKLTERLDLNSYIDYLITLEIVGLNDHKNSDLRGWKAPGSLGGTYPLDGKFRLIAWDGDGMDLRGDPAYREGGLYLKTKEELDRLALLISQDLFPHLHLMAHPSYQAAWDQRLRAHLTGTGAPMTSAAIQQRYRAAAADVRLTLECEAMRILRSVDSTDSWTGGAESLLEDWSWLIANARRERLPYSRGDLKFAARESGLLRDVLPPTISVSGRAVTLTRPGTTGSLYYHTALADESVDDPAYSVTSPSATAYPTRPPYTFPSSATQGEVSARIFGPDLDGLNAWSAQLYRHLSFP